MKYATLLFGFGTAAAGILDIVFREFEPAHQPIQAWGDHIPGIAFLAVLAGLWLTVAGVALLIRPQHRVVAVSLTVIYAVFCFFPLPRIISGPHYLGHTPAVYVGVLLGVCQQLLVFAGAACLCLPLFRASTVRSRATVALRAIVGLCCLDFGLNHFLNTAGTAPMIPTWLPLGGAFWTWFTGAAFIAAGLALVSGILDVLAARMLGLMLLVFSVLVLMPGILAAPHNHIKLGSNAYNLSAAGAACILAETLRRCRLPESSSPRAAV